MKEQNALFRSLDDPSKKVFRLRLAISHEKGFQINSLIGSYDVCLIRGRDNKIPFFRSFDAKIARE